MLDIMRVLGLKRVTDDTLDNFRAVLAKWNAMPYRLEGNRLIFGKVAPGQRATGIILDKDGAPTTAFTIMYGGRK